MGRRSNKRGTSTSSTSRRYLRSRVMSANLHVHSSQCLYIQGDDNSQQSGKRSTSHARSTYISCKLVRLPLGAATRVETDSAAKDQIGTGSQITVSISLSTQAISHLLSVNCLEEEINVLARLEIDVLHYNRVQTIQEFLNRKKQNLKYIEGLSKFLLYFNS